MTSSALPTTLLAGRFEVRRTLGQGAFGRTLLARDSRSERDIAIKLLDERGRPDAKAYQLFEREADVLRGLRHHGIPEVYETFQESWLGAPSAFLVMEYIDGASLQQIIDEKRPISTTDTMHLLLELLGILDYLHNRVPPILHRDIKPANIIVEESGRATLVDLGLSAPWRERGATATGLTPKYAAPELLAGGSLTVRAEVYALGVAILLTVLVALASGIVLAWPFLVYGISSEGSDQSMSRKRIARISPRLIPVSRAKRITRPINGLWQSSAARRSRDSSPCLNRRSRLALSSRESP